MKVGKRVGLFCLMVLLGCGWLFLYQAGPKATESQETLADSVIRLHVLANSDEARDQEIKYKVRDAVVSYLTPKLTQAITKGDAEKIVAANQDELLAVVNKILQQEQAGYEASLQMGHFDFPVRTYGTLIFPAGYYDAVRILLGSGQGKNWWCVLFPPLCLIDGMQTASPPAKETAASQPEAEAERPVIHFKSKLVELITGQ